MRSILSGKRAPWTILLIGITIRFVLVAIANYTWTNSGWSGLFLGGDWNWEGFLDYEFWYTSGGSTPEEDHGFTRLFLTGELPYRDWGAAYNMTPLFLFIIEPFWVLPLGWWGPAIPIIICDALIGVMIYGIAKKLFKDEGKATLAGVCAALAPINLFYVGYIWLNPGIFTFFAIASLYFLINDRFDASAIFLALAVMSKQVAGIFLPFLLVYVVRSRGKTWVLRYFLIFTAICVAISAPFLIVYPNEYISMLRSRATGPVWGVFVFPEFNETVGFTAMLQYFEIWVPIITFVGVAINTYIVFIVALAIVFLGLEYELRRKDANTSDRNAFFIMSSFAAITIMIGLFPLGVYKYYMATLAPFWALYSIEAGYALSSRRYIGAIASILIWIMFNVLTLFAPRIWNPYLTILPFVVFFLPRAIRHPKKLLRPVYSLEYIITKSIDIVNALIHLLLASRIPHLFKQIVLELQVKIRLWLKR